MWLARNEDLEFVVFNEKPYRSNIDGNLSKGFWIRYDGDDLMVNIDGRAEVEVVNCGVVVPNNIIEMIDDCTNYPTALIDMTWVDEPREIGALKNN